MTELEIRDALGRATEHLVAPPDLLERVRNGGRRKLVRRRAVLLAGVGVADAAVPLTVWQSDLAQPAAAGDLGGDRWFLRRVRGAWSDGSHSYDADGPPRVLWALNTPAGPVALLRQPVRIPGGERRDQYGWVGTEQGRLTRAGGDQLAERGRTPPSALLAGRPRNVLVVVGSAALSTGYTIDRAGKVVRSFTPARLVQQVPTQLGLVNLALKAGNDRVPLHHFGEFTPPGWVEAPPRLDRTLPGGDEDWDLPAEYGDPFGYHTQWLGDWNIRGATPDGRRFVVRTLSMDGDTRSFWFLGGPQPHLAGTQKTPDRPLVLVDLPGRQGRVTALFDAKMIWYRTAGSTDWQLVDGDTALLPPGANPVELWPR